MSNQPRPTTGEHNIEDSAEVTDMKLHHVTRDHEAETIAEATLPTTGEIGSFGISEKWTPEYVESMVLNDGGSLDGALLANTHNAALATAQGAQHHMEACRVLMNLPNDEVLYVAIQQLQGQLAAEQKRCKELEERLKLTGAAK